MRATTTPAARRPVTSSANPATTTAPASTSPTIGETHRAARATTETTIATTTGAGMLARLLMEALSSPHRRV